MKRSDSMLGFMLILFFIFNGNTVFANGTVFLNDKDNEYRIGKSLYIFEDPKGDLTFNQITDTGVLWNRSESESPGFGFSDSVYWVKFTVQNKSDKILKWFLEVAYPMLDNIKLYKPDEEGAHRIISAGDRQPFLKRDVEYRNFIFPLGLKPGEKKIYYMRIKSESSINIPLIIWNPLKFNEFNNNEQMVLGIYYGGMLIILVYNIFLFMGVRHINYFYYILFIASWILFQFTLNGYSFQYLWTDSIWWANMCLPLFIFFVIIWMQFFSKSFLNLKKNAPVLDKIVAGIIVIAIAGVITSFFARYSVSIRFATFMALLSVLFSLGTSFYVLTRGYRPARIYVAAWTFLIVGVVVYTLKTFGVMPGNFFTNWSIQFGSVSVVVLLSLALVDQINILRKEKTLALTILNEAYSRFVPHEFLKLLDKSDVVDVKLGDQVQKEITILFSDIRSFTTLSESMTPEENFNFLNSYLKRISPIIRENGGFIDKYIGDAIMALFVSGSESAVKASVEMHREVARYNIDRGRAGFKPIKIGIGVHSGSVMLGTIGEERRIDGTVIADDVNLASRIEGLTKEFGAMTILSSNTLKEINDTSVYNHRSLGKIRVKGKGRAIEIAEIFDGDADVEIKKETKFDFEKALGFYGMENFIEATEIFRGIVDRNPGDRAAEYYLEKSVYYMGKRDLSDWDGVENMMNK